jgi:hypothetical protein
MDPVRREPRILREVMSSDVQNGTRITVRWPKTACHLLAAAKHRFVQMACAFTTFNPHLTMRGRWNDGEFLAVPATDREWRKWRTCDPTSAFWYGVEHFERYMAAHIARDEDQGRSGRTVRDFISELRGLARSGKQKLVLAESDTSGVALATLFASGRSAIASLLNSCQKHTKRLKAGRSRSPRRRSSAGGLLRGWCRGGKLQIPQAFRHDAKRPALRDRDSICLLSGRGGSTAIERQFFGRDR